jgi:hypothetical protein
MQDKKGEMEELFLINPVLAVRNLIDFSSQSVVFSLLFGTQVLAPSGRYQP